MKKALFATMLMTAMLCACGNGSREVELQEAAVYLPRHNATDEHSRLGAELLSLVPETGTLTWRDNPDEPGHLLFSLTAKVRLNQELDTAVYAIPDVTDFSYQIIFKDVEDQYLNFEGMSDTPLFLSPGLSLIDHASEVAKVKELLTASKAGDVREVTFVGSGAANVANDEKLQEKAVKAVLSASLMVFTKEEANR